MIGLLSAPGMAHIGVFAINLVWIVLLGWLTRGWVMRILGWAYMILGAFLLVATVTDPGGAVAYVVSGIALGVVGVVIWVGGHMLYARAHGRYKSQVARSIVRRVSGWVLRVIARGNRQRVTP